MKFRNIRIRKRGGGFRTQKARVLRSGKLKFVKNTSRSHKRSTSNKSFKRISTTRRRSNKVAKKHRSKKSMGKVGKTISMGVGAGLSGVANSLFGMVGLTGIPDDVASIAVGTLVETQTKGVVKHVGRGMQVAGIAQLTSNVSSGLLGGLMNRGNSNSGTAGFTVQR